MSEIVNQSLQKIAKGTGIIFIGTIIGMLFAFIGRVLIARYVTQSEYGIFSLALVLLNIFVTISTLGLRQGAPRQIAYYRGKDNKSNVKGVIFSSLQITIIASVLLFIILFLTSDLISTKFFHSPELSTSLKIFSSAIPFYALIYVFSSIFRGFDRMDIQVWFENILRNIFLLLFLGVIILLNLAFLGIIYAYISSIIVTCIIFIAWIIKKLPSFSKAYSMPYSEILKGGENINHSRKELLFFSLPLLASTALYMIMHQTDTLILGYFGTSDIVGLYNGASPIAQFIAMPLSSMAFIFIPIISQLYSKNLMPEIKRNYEISTKWLFVTVFPISFMFFLFPETILNFLFGPSYIEGSVALCILAAGYLILTTLGQTTTLIAMGRSRLLMYTTLGAVILNIILNITLIPLWGIIGAAVATAFSVVIEQIFCLVLLYRISKIHPFTKNYLKIIVISIIILCVGFFVKDFLISTFWMLLLFLILFLVIYTLSLLLTKSFDDEDIMIFLSMEKRLGVNLTIIKNILRRFT